MFELIVEKMRVQYMKYRVLNILIIGFLVLSGIFGAFAPVSPAISYYMLLGGWIAGLCKLVYGYIKAVKAGEYLSGEIFTIIVTVALIFMKMEIEAVVFTAVYVIAEEILQYIYKSIDKKKNKFESYLPQNANIFKDGVETQIDARELEIGNIVIVNQDEMIPADGEVFRGKSLLDGKYFNIEQLREVEKGDKVLGGYVNRGETIQIEITKTWENSFFKKCISTAVDAANGVSQLEVKLKLYEKILKVLVVIVSMAAAGIMVFGGGAEVTSAAMVMFVAVSSVVLYNTAKVSGKSMASFIYDKLEEGLVVKNREVLEKIERLEGLILEDDGRLAEGDYQLLSIIEREGVAKEEILTYAAHLKYFSKSNLAKAIVKGYQQLAKYEGLNEETAIKYTAVSHIEELPGKGITGKVAGKFVCAGNDRLMALLNITDLPQSEENTMIHVAVNQNYIGSLLLRYTPKEGMEDILSHWNSNGINNYAVDKGNYEELLDELKEVSSEDGTVAYVATSYDERKCKDADIAAVIDIVEGGEFTDVDILDKSSDLKSISNLKKAVVEKTGNLKVQGILLLVLKTICYGAAAATGLNIVIPVAVDALITIFYAKINI